MTEKGQPQDTSPNQLLMRLWISTAVVLGLLAQEKENRCLLLSHVQMSQPIGGERGGQTRPGAPTIHSHAPAPSSHSPIDSQLSSGASHHFFSAAGISTLTSNNMTPEFRSSTSASLRSKSTSRTSGNCIVWSWGPWSPLWIVWTNQYMSWVQGAELTCFLLLCEAQGTALVGLHLAGDTLSGGVWTVSDSPREPQPRNLTRSSCSLIIRIIEKFPL